jgi:hypothetical protein
MAAILPLAGFTVQDADDAYRSYQLRVAAGPTPGVPRMWALRDDEVAMERNLTRQTLPDPWVFAPSRMSS